jgi:hypothetical protein
LPGVRRGQAVSPTIYHVTPITPDPRLIALAGRHFCVSFGYQQQADLMDRVAAGVMFDNGAFRAFTKGHPTDWPKFYAWLEERLFWPGRWAVIPDVIAEGGQAQDALLTEWPFGHRGAPVYHTGEPIDRLLRLLDHWPRVCIGSTDDHWQIWLPGLHGKVLNSAWRHRMDEIWEAVLKRHVAPVIHMLRGTAVAHLYPFHSADSSSVGQNSHRYKLPLFAGTDEEHTGVVAYADRLEARAAGRAQGGQFK